MSACTVADCGLDANHPKIGLCEKHYYRLRRHGDTATKLRNANGEGSRPRRGKYTRVTVNGVRKMEHVAIVEGILGYELPTGAEVHHVDEDKTNNEHSNLVVCPDRAYHALLHARTRAYDMTGNASKRPCRYCAQYDDLLNLVPNGTSHYHPACHALDQQRRRAIRKTIKE